jgi:DNA-directed RNA polymerase beta' subunit
MDASAQAYIKKRLEDRKPRTFMNTEQKQTRMLELKAKLLEIEERVMKALYDRHRVCSELYELESTQNETEEEHNKRQMKRQRTAECELKTLREDLDKHTVIDCHTIGATIFEESADPEERARHARMKEVCGEDNTSTKEDLAKLFAGINIECKEEEPRSSPLMANEAATMSMTIPPVPPPVFSNEALPPP